MRARRVLTALLALLVLSGAAAGLLAWRSLVTELAVSTALDTVTQSVNAIVKERMHAGAGEGLVSLERSADGSVTAVTTNVSAVNALAAEVLEQAVAATQEEELHVRVPIGSVLGLKRLSVPVSVKLLSSSRADFRSELESAGINQTRHRIVLTLRVDAALFMPWRMVETAAETEILISETVIVGRVPQMYWGNE